MAKTNQKSTRNRRSGNGQTSLKLWRMRKGITQVEAANIVGVHLVTYIRLERGTSSRPVGNIVARKVAAVIRRSVGQVIDEYEQRRTA